MPDRIRMALLRANPSLLVTNDKACAVQRRTEDWSQVDVFLVHGTIRAREDKIRGAAPDGICEERLQFRVER